MICVISRAKYVGKSINFTTTTDATADAAAIEVDERACVRVGRQRGGVAGVAMEAGWLVIPEDHY